MVPMPSLQKLPIDVTGHILLYVKLLNDTWPTLDELMDFHDWEEDSELTMDYKQALWILMVERVLLGKNAHLRALNQEMKLHGENRIIEPDAKYSYIITARWDSSLVDLSTDKPVSKDRRWIVDSFIYPTTNLGAYLFDPPTFDIVILRGEGKFSQCSLFVKDVRFFLEEI